MHRLLIPVLFSTLATISFAQSADQPKTNEKPIDEIIAVGTISKADPAMGAFARGDYKTAEIEFDNNFKFLRRAEFALTRSVETSRNNSVTSELQTGPGEVSSTPLSGGQQVAVSFSSQTGVVETATTIGRQPQVEDLGFQLYMRGLSQIQLGKYDEAKLSFKRALNFNRRLYDAKFRLGILELRDGDRDAAEAQLAQLKKDQKWCKYCDGKQEIDAGVAILSASLGY